jgi:hypothetical protein
LAYSSTININKYSGLLKSKIILEKLPNIKLIIQKFISKPYSTFRDFNLVKDLRYNFEFTQEFKCFGDLNHLGSLKNYPNELIASCALKTGDSKIIQAKIEYIRENYEDYELAEKIKPLSNFEEYRQIMEALNSNDKNLLSKYAITETMGKLERIEQLKLYLQTFMTSMIDSDFDCSILSNPLEREIFQKQIRFKTAEWGKKSEDSFDEVITQLQINQTSGELSESPLQTKVCEIGRLKANSSVSNEFQNFFPKFKDSISKALEYVSKFEQLDDQQFRLSLVKEFENDQFKMVQDLENQLNQYQDDGQFKEMIVSINSKRITESKPELNPVQLEIMRKSSISRIQNSIKKLSSIKPSTYSNLYDLFEAIESNLDDPSTISTMIYAICLRNNQNYQEILTNIVQYNEISNFDFKYCAEFVEHIAYEETWKKEFMEPQDFDKEFTNRDNTLVAINNFNNYQKNPQSFFRIQIRKLKNIQILKIRDLNTFIKKNSNSKDPKILIKVEQSTQILEQLQSLDLSKPTNPELLSELVKLDFDDNLVQQLVFTARIILSSSAKNYITSIDSDNITEDEIEQAYSMIQDSASKSYQTVINVANNKIPKKPNPSQLQILSNNKRKSKIFEKSTNLPTFQAELNNQKTIDTGLKSQVTLFPTRLVLNEFSGHIAGACWASKSTSMAMSNPNVTSLILIPNQSTIDQTLGGACALIEGNNKDGEKLLIIRGINPNLTYLDEFKAEQTITALVEYVREQAILIGAKPAIVIENSSGGAATNRSPLIPLLKKYELAANVVELDDSNSTVFNGYTLDGKTFYI